MIYFDRPYIKIHWDERIKAVWAEWLSYAEGSDFRSGLNAGLALVEQKGSRRWLADTRNLGAVTQEDQDWSSGDWFPRLLKAGVRRMAFVVPRKVVAQMAVKRVVGRVDKELLTSHFDTLEDARMWLMNQG